MKIVMILLVVMAILLTANVCMTAVLFKKHVDKAVSDYREEAVEEALSVEADREAEAQRRERDASLAFDEGIENIMAYAVNGKTGLGE